MPLLSDELGLHTFIISGFIFKSSFFHFDAVIMGFQNAAAGANQSTKLHSEVDITLCTFLGG
jgi:hypothetical protein